MDSNNRSDNSDHDNDPQQQQQHATIPKELSKKFVQAFAPPPPQQQEQTTSTISSGSSTKRVSAETAEAMSEVLRLFVVEAHTRASIEAECDQEGALLGKQSEDDVDGSSSDHVVVVDARTTNAVRKRQKQKQPRVPIRAEHVTKVAANLIMDFS